MTHPAPHQEGAGFGQRPSGAGRRTAAGLAAAIAMVAGGCSVGEPQYSDTPRDDFAAQATVDQTPPRAKAGKHGKGGKHGKPGAKGTTPAVSPSTSAEAVPSAGGSTAGSTAGSGDGGGQGPASAPGFSRVATLSDGSGDIGLTGGPAYADLTGIAVDDNGSRLRFTVSLAGRVPSSFPTGEVEGIGLDIFRGGGIESDYQVFLDGGSSWRAFLQTPRGFVPFPGTLSVGNTTLVVEVPWSSIGGRSGFALGAFADWSRDGSLVNSSSYDAAPDSGNTPVSVD